MKFGFNADPDIFESGIKFYDNASHELLQIMPSNAVQDPNCAIPPPVSGVSADMQVVLDEHNRYRRMLQRAASTGGQPRASNMVDMQWDDKLAQVAQNYADTCPRGHNSQRSAQYKALGGMENYVGENLAYSSTRNDMMRLTKEQDTTVTMQGDRLQSPE